MKLIGLIMLATLCVPAKVEIELIGQGVFYVDAWDSEAGLLVKSQKKAHKVMFNMEHILFAEEKEKYTTITVEYGSDTRQFLIKMEYEDVMKGIIKTYNRSNQ